MVWKDWSYTKKGAIILGGLGFLIVWGGQVVTLNCTAIVTSRGCGFFEAIIWPLNLLAGVVYGLGGVIIGAIIGWIVGKIKSR